jgi:hypothetical protein
LQWRRSLLVCRWCQILKDGPSCLPPTFRNLLFFSQRFKPYNRSILEDERGTQKKREARIEKPSFSATVANQSWRKKKKKHWDTLTPDQHSNKEASDQKP